MFHIFPVHWRRPVHDIRQSHVKRQPVYQSLIIACSFKYPQSPPDDKMTSGVTNAERTSAFIYHLIDIQASCQSSNSQLFVMQHSVLYKELS
jgi:hypothetical protein